MYHNASKSAMICNDGPASDSCLLRHRCASKNVVDCDVGKSKRQAVVNEGDDANEIGEVVRADISGEFPVKGRRGPWYFSGTWDKKTRHGSVKLIRKKSEAAKHFVEFKPWFERQSGKKTKRRIVGNLFPGRCIGTIRASCAVRPNTNGALHPTWHCLPGSGFSSTPCWGHVSRSSDMESDVRFPWLSGSSGSDGSASPKRRLPDTVPCNAARPDPQLDRFFDTYLKSETSASADLETGFYRLYAERFSSLLGVPIGGVCDKTPADVPLDENADDTMVASLDRIASNEEPTGHDHNDEPDPVPAKERLESLAKRLGSTMQTPTRQARRRTLRRRDRSRAKRTDEGRSLSARPDAGMPLPAKAEGDRPVVPAVVAPASTPLQRISEVLLEYSSVPPHCLVASERRPGVVLLKEVARSSPEFTACQDLVDIGMATRASACIISRIVKIFSYHRHSVWAQWRQGLPVGHIVGNRMPAQERSRYVFMLHSADPKTLCSIAERGSFDGLSDQYDLLFSSSLEAFSQLIQPRTRQRKLQRQQQHGPRHRAIACCIRLTRVLDRSESLDSLLDEHRRSRATWAREFDLVRTTSNPCHIMALDRSVCTPVYIFDYSLASTLYNAADS